MNLCNLYIVCVIHLESTLNINYMQLEQSPEVMHLISKLSSLHERVTMIPLLISVLEHPLVYMVSFVLLLCPVILEVPLVGKKFTLNDFKRTHICV